MSKLNINSEEQTVIIHGVKYKAIDEPLDKTKFRCADCDIYKAKIPRHLGSIPLCCEDKYEKVNDSCYKQFEKGFKRIWKKV